jgi:hypothetical protein
MGDLGDKIRALSDTLYAMDYTRLDGLAEEADHLERELFDALHAPQVSDPYQAGYEMGAMAAEEWKRDAAVSRALLDEFMANPRDEYHTMTELYYYRMLYNAHAFNAWARHGTHFVAKSWRHHDGEECFGGGWFIVVAHVGDGQVSNHYEAEHWTLFNVPYMERAPEWDGHTPATAAERLRKALTEEPW